MTDFSHIPQIPLNTPSKPSDRDGLVTGGQAKRRYQDTFFDIHQSSRFPRGRPWTGPRELASMPHDRHPDPFCGGDLQQGEYVVDDYGNVDRAATFRSTWQAPWVPLKRYFVFVYERKLIRFNYRQFRLDEERGLNDYFRGAAKLGVGLNIRVEKGQVPHFQITELLGMPSRMLEIADAALAGDPWLLGHIDEPNPKLAEILGLSVDGLPLPAQPAPPLSVEQVLQAPQESLDELVARKVAEVLAAQKAEHARKSVEGRAKAQRAKAGV